MKKHNISTQGFFIGTTLTLFHAIALLVSLKLFGIVSWSWWVVTLPISAPIALLFVAVVLYSTYITVLFWLFVTGVKK